MGGVDSIGLDAGSRVLQVTSHRYANEYASEFFVNLVSLVCFVHQVSGKVWLACGADLIYQFIAALQL